MAESTQFNFARMRLILWIIVIIVGAVVSVVYMTRPPAPRIGHPFTLSSTQGGTFTDADLKGTPTLMYFGYTFCPDVCPTTLAALTGWRTQLGLGPDQLRIVMVTVDPERDTLDSLRTYLTGFGSPIIGLRGTDSETEQAKKVFGVYSEKVNDAGASDYLVNHTASVFVMDRDGNFASTIDYNEPADTAKGKIERVVSGS